MPADALFVSFLKKGRKQKVIPLSRRQMRVLQQNQYFSCERVNCRATNYREC